jgi:hypothetical protein
LVAIREEEMSMRLVIAAFSALGLVVTMGTGASAQDQRYIDYGGFQVPLPSGNRDSPEILTPGQSRQQPAQAQSSRSDTGSEDGVPRSGSDGYTSTRVSEVTVSTSQERYSWFYAASEIYAGIIPSIRDSLPHIAIHQRWGAQSRRANSVTWIGFQPLDGYTRVFVQLARNPEYTVSEREDGYLIEIVFDNTRLSLSNFQRFMDTSFFGRSVSMIDAAPLSGGRSRLVISLSELSSYTVTTNDDYLFIDFQDTGRR